MQKWMIILTVTILTSIIPVMLSAEFVEKEIDNLGSFGAHKSEGIASYYKSIESTWNELDVLEAMYDTFGEHRQSDRDLEDLKLAKQPDDIPAPRQNEVLVVTFLGSHVILTVWISQPVPGVYIWFYGMILVAVE